ncbi:MAG: 4-hydroxybenzoate octaprenyltransferase [Acidiferrobacteraceae bacterium]
MIRGDRWRDYLRLMRLHRPIGSLLLLWPTLWALWIAASGRPRIVTVAVFVAGVLLMRSAGCIINDYLDRDFDAQVWRTRDRPIASGRVGGGEALTLAALLALMALPLAWFVGRPALWLAPAAIALAATYPLMKRYTDLPQAYLGVAFGWGIPMAFAAEQGRVPRIGWLVLLANVFWAIAYDTAYAMADRDDDRRAGVRSSAILFGHADRFWIGTFHVAALVTLGIVGRRLHLGPLYDLGLALAATFAVYQQYLIRTREPRACLAAFNNNNWFGGSVFAGLFLSYLWR